MNRPPPDSPIDLRALILYDNYQMKSAGTSYKNYEKLSEAMGKEAISYEEYKYWFEKYSKKRERDDLPKPDIRGCILSDVINGKTAEKSIDNLCKTFKDHKIDKEDHDYWFKRFENGDLFNQVTFSNLPEDLITEIVEKCDLVSFFQLRNVSHSLRSIVEHSKPPITHIIVECGGNHVSFKLNNQILVYFTDRKGVDLSKVYFKHLCKYESDDYTKIAFNYLEMLLKNPKLQLNFLQIEIRNDISKKSFPIFRDLLTSLSHKIHVEHFFLSVPKYEDITTVVKCMKPGTLERLIVYGYNDGELSNIDELIGTEQWKQAKLFSYENLLHTSIEHFFHFDEFYINIVSMSIEDVLNLSHALSNSPNFESCRVKVKRYDQEAVMNALRLDQGCFSELFPNLLFYLSPYSIEIADI